MLQFDQSIWKESSENSKPGSKIWYDDSGIKLVVFHIGVDRELLPLLKDEKAVRMYYRDNYAKKNIGVIECDLVSIQEHRAVKTIAKRITEEVPAWYMAALAIPMKKESYVVTLYAQEQSSVLSREEAVLAKLRDNPNVSFDSNSGLPADWQSDPYFPNFNGPSPCNLADNVYYDYEFPDHSLSRLRKRMREIMMHLSLPEASMASSKAWWKFWT